MSEALDFGAWVIKAPDSALLLSNELQIIFINRDRITTRSPGSGDASVGRYNGRFGQSSDRRGHTTPVQRQGYPSERSGVGRQTGAVRADFVSFGDIEVIEYRG